MDNMIVTKDTDYVTVSEHDIAEMCFDYFIDGVNYANDNLKAIVNDMAYNASKMQGSFAKAANEMKENRNGIFKAFLPEFQKKHGELLQRGRKKIILPA